MSQQCRSTLADMVGQMAWLVRPLVDALARHVMAGDGPRRRRAQRLDTGAGGALPERADPEVRVRA